SHPPTLRTGGCAGIFWQALSWVTRSPGCRAKPANKDKATGKSARSNPGNPRVDIPSFNGRIQGCRRTSASALHLLSPNPTLSSRCSAGRPGISRESEYDARPLRSLGGFQECKRGRYQERLSASREKTAP